MGNMHHPKREKQERGRRGTQKRGCVTKEREAGSQDGVPQPGIEKAVSLDGSPSGALMESS